MAFTVLNEGTATPDKKRGDSITDRQERLPGWKQERIESGRVLILGAGALGNEVVKNLALMGVGYMFVVDFDHIEPSNLSRAVLFRKSDVQDHRSKSDVLSERAKEISVNPNAVIKAFDGDLVWDLGQGVFRRVDVVIGCLDNVEARLAANATCAWTKTPFIEGGIRGLAGHVALINAPETACWACTTSEQERDHARDRYDSCSKVMLREVQAGRVPTVQIASSVVAGFQTQEAVKIILGLPWACGMMIYYDASRRLPDLDVLKIARRPDCWCSRLRPIEQVIELPLSAVRNTLQDLMTMLCALGYKDHVIRLRNAFVMSRRCGACGQVDTIMRPRHLLDVGILTCPACGARADKIQLQEIEIIPPKPAENQFTLEVWHQFLNTSLADLGFPRLSFVYFSREGAAFDDLHIAELTADAGDVMGGGPFVDVRPRATQVVEI